MGYMTVSVPDELIQRLKTLPEINKSRMFQEYAEERIEIMDALKEKNPSISEKELFSQAEIIHHLKDDIKLMSYEFGEKVFNEWIIENDHRKFLRKIASIYIKDTRHMHAVQGTLYEYTENQLEPIKVYEDIFSKNVDVPLNHNEFIRGFI